MIKAIVALSFVGALSAQIHVTFSQQGAEVERALSGRVVPGVGLASVDIVNHGTDNRVISAEEIYQAAQILKISTIAPYLAGPLLDRQKSRSKVQIVLDLAGAGGSLTGVLGTTSVIKMPKGAAAGLSLAPFAISAFTTFFLKRAPADTSVRVNLLQGDIGLGPKRATSRLFLYRYHGDWDPKIADLIE